MTLYSFIIKRDFDRYGCALVATARKTHMAPEGISPFLHAKKSDGLVITDSLGADPNAVVCDFKQHFAAILSQTDRHRSGFGVASYVRQ
jgi:hypothetical protein